MRAPFSRPQKPLQNQGFPQFRLSERDLTAPRDRCESLAGHAPISDPIITLRVPASTRIFAVTLALPVSGRFVHSREG
jgi:hypothetical protein